VDDAGGAGEDDGVGEGDGARVACGWDAGEGGLEGGDADEGAEGEGCLGADGVEGAEAWHCGGGGGDRTRVVAKGFLGGAEEVVKPRWIFLLRLFDACCLA